MGKNFFKKSALVLLCLGVLLMSICVAAYAAPPTADQVINGNGVASDTGGFKEVAGLGITFVNILMGIGGLIVVAGLIFTGINFSLSSVNPDKKKLAYAGLVSSIIGGLIVFGAWKFAGVLKGEADKNHADSRIIQLAEYPSENTKLI
jgi:hypothetical protein